MDNIYSKLIYPEIITDVENLASNKNQVAGHSGICSILDDSDICLKPFNTECVRGRREHLFYQLINLVSQSPNYSLKYNLFPLLTLPSQIEKCDCVVNRDVLISLSKFVPKFYHVKHSLRGITKEEFLRAVYSSDLKCPCYGSNPEEKILCARKYDKLDFMCLEDLTAHCSLPCIMDIKIGRVTYDPMAIKEKVVEQSTKYKRLKEFGFRILGMKLGQEFIDKSFGRTLENKEHVLKALESFFDPLETSESRLAVLKQVIGRLSDLIHWFELKNIDQLRFFSSSLLIVYDIHQYSNSVRVSMIDFAHVFHIHDIDSPLDNNYLYGIQKLKCLLMSLLEKYTS